jgi:hypothetical protein
MSGAAAGAAAAAAIANAIKASGTLVEVEPDEFSKLVERNQEALVVHAPAGLFGNKHRYLMGYRGLAFFTDTGHEMPLGTAQVVLAKKIWIPG